MGCKGSKQPQEEYNEEDSWAASEEGAVPKPEHLPSSNVAGEPCSRSNQRKGKPCLRQLDVSLEELYTGTVKRLQSSRSVLAESQECPECLGVGQIEQRVQLGPMVMVSSAQCGYCAGKGMRWRTRQETNMLEVHVPAGASHGHRIVFVEEGDEAPAHVAGDVVFVVNVLPHVLYTRHGADLYITKHIALVESLCGFETRLRHLSGSMLVLKSAPGEVLMPVDFDPSKPSALWEVFADTTVSLQDSGRVRSEDAQVVKEACATGALRDENVNCFVCARGEIRMKIGTREQCLAAMTPLSGSTVHLKACLAAVPLKCAAGKGMPSFKFPGTFGNLFVNFNVKMPTTISSEAASVLRQLLPPPIHAVTAIEGRADVDAYSVVERNPITSYNQNKPVVKETDDDDFHRHNQGSHTVQCAQQ